MTSAILISTVQLCPISSEAILPYCKQQKAWAGPGNETILCICNSKGFSILQAVESWAGPRNKAILCICKIVSLPGPTQAFCHFTIPESLVPRASPSFQSLAVFNCTASDRKLGEGPVTRLLRKSKRLSMKSLY